MSSRVAEGRLSELAGIGEALAGRVPPGMLEMLWIEGLGSKKVKRLWQDLGLGSIEELRLACEEGE